MPKFSCAYAYEVSCYFDFTVEAKSERAAKRKLNAALKAGRFNDEACEPFWENTSGHRAFIVGVAKPHQDTYPTLEAVVEAPDSPRPEFKF